MSNNCNNDKWCIWALKCLSRFPTAHFKSVSSLVVHKMMLSLSGYGSVRIKSPNTDLVLNPKQTEIWDELNDLLMTPEYVTFIILGDELT